MKDFSLSSKRVGNAILDGLRMPHPDGVGHDNFLCAQHLARLIAALVDDINPGEQMKAKDEAKRLYGIGSNLNDDRD